MVEEDPLPAPAAVNSNAYSNKEQRKIRKSVAIVLCLFLGLALVLCPQVVFEQSHNDLWILKYNSSVNQAPRGAFFGALAVLPIKLDLDSVQLPQVWEINRGTTEAPHQHQRNWIIMVWYGSTYV